MRPQVPHWDAHAMAEVHCHYQLLEEGSAEWEDQDVRHAFKSCSMKEGGICMQCMARSRCHTGLQWK